jgi:hypothetical protein
MTASTPRAIKLLIRVPHLVQPLRVETAASRRHDIDHLPAVEHHHAAWRFLACPIAQLNQAAHAPSAIRQVPSEVAENEVGTIIARIHESSDVPLGVGDLPLRGHRASCSLAD